jgi:hypothetical protein
MSVVQRLVALVNKCFLCPDADFTTPQNLRKHLMNVHQLQLPGRPLGLKHRDTHDIAYISQKKNHPNVEIRNSCPSCRFHSIQTEDLKMYVETEHRHNRRDLTEDIEQEHQSKKTRSEDVSFSTRRRIVTFTALPENFTSHINRN